MALSKKQLEEFKERLLEMRGQLTKSVQTVSEDVKGDDQPKGYSQHQADEGTDDFVQQISIEVSSKEFDMLRLIDRALEKLDEGTYGICDLTEVEIPIKRLEAIPYATMTVDAQDKLEKGIF
ncbi:MAG: General stress protein 16O [Chlamydiia bacterium]|nr:General stress protein 16O [Chlamydiia bacterium]MCH9616159.1 General stress protein 16O [Chlamydiia bacterium]MCH9629855.1 General stress protein 16O [Chlamydiia bacterium]